MYEIEYYRNRNGESEIEKLIQDLLKKNDKNSRINLKKISMYIELLKVNGLNLGKPYLKHLSGEIWELRPIRNRILFAAIKNNKFILLHTFIKDTQKTPKKEIEQANNNLKEYIERKGE